MPQEPNVVARSQPLALHDIMVGEEVDIKAMLVKFCYVVVRLK